MQLVSGTRARPIRMRRSKKNSSLMCRNNGCSDAKEVRVWSECGFNRPGMLSIAPLQHHAVSIWTTAEEKPQQRNTGEFLNQKLQKAEARDSTEMLTFVCAQDRFLRANPTTGFQEERRSRSLTSLSALAPPDLHCVRHPIHHRSDNPSTISSAVPQRTPLGIRFTAFTKRCDQVAAADTNAMPVYILIQTARRSFNSFREVGVSHCWI
jgi:hypothetical protein